MHSQHAHLVVLAELLELLLGAGLHLGAVLAEGLELVDELVHHVPQPLVWQLHVNIAVQDDLQETQTIVLDPVTDS
jgi:hypothetical protein